MSTPTPLNQPQIDRLKREARKRRNADKSGPTLTQHLEALSKEAGFNSWAHLLNASKKVDLKAMITPARPEDSKPVLAIPGSVVVARSSDGTIIRVPKKP